MRGPWREDGLILDTENGPVSLCTGSACDWYADHVAIERVGAQVTSASAITAPVLCAGKLAEHMRALSAQGRVYLLGSALAGGIKPDPPTLTVDGEVVRFVYAGPELLERLTGRTLPEVEAVIQTRHAPGQVLTEAPAQRAPAAELPPLLQRYWLGPEADAGR